MVLKNDSLSYFVYTYVLLFDSLCWQYSHMLFMLTVYTYFVFLIMQVVPTIYTNIRGWYCSILKMIFLYILKMKNLIIPSYSWDDAMGFSLLVLLNTLWRSTSEIRNQLTLALFLEFSSSMTFLQWRCIPFFKSNNSVKRLLLIP